MSHTVITTESAPVVIKFQINDYTDALHFANQAERDQYSDEQIDAMCQARYDNWLAVIEASRNRPEPTEEEKAAHLESLRQQQEALAAQIAALTPQVQGE